MADVDYTVVSSDISQSNAAGSLAADIDSEVYSLGVQGKYTFNVGGFDIAPHLGVRYTRVDIEDYTVSGVIDGDSIQLPTNNFGHCLHGGPKGWQYQVYPSPRI